jgi:hypothetical protein
VRARAAGIRTRTTKLYGRRSDVVSLDEVEKGCSNLMALG